MKNPPNPPLSAIAEDARTIDFIRKALAEDCGRGDVTSQALVPADARVSASILSRGDYVVAGVTVAAKVFELLDPKLTLHVACPDGQRIRKNDPVLKIGGAARSILTAERTALNFLQRMSGVATLTARLVELTASYGTIILDTRKTTPNLRVFEKYAVHCGGGANHRMGLYDRVLIKDNHLNFWKRTGGNARTAVEEARRGFPELQVEIEVESVADLREALKGKPDWVLLDNMSLDSLRECAAICKGHCQTEASGGITPETIAAVAATGVDAISVGYITHSVPAADYTLEFD